MAVCKDKFFTKYVLFIILFLVNFGTLASANDKIQRVKQEIINELMELTKNKFGRAKCNEIEIGKNYTSKFFIAKDFCSYENSPEGCEEVISIINNSLADWAYKSHLSDGCVTEYYEPTEAGYKWLFLSEKLFDEYYQKCANKPAICRQQETHHYHRTSAKLYEKLGRPEDAFLAMEHVLRTDKSIINLQGIVQLSIETERYKVAKRYLKMIKARSREVAEFLEKKYPQILD